MALLPLLSCETRCAGCAECVDAVALRIAVASGAAGGAERVCSAAGVLLQQLVGGPRAADRLSSPRAPALLLAVVVAAALLIDASTSGRLKRHRCCVAGRCFMEWLQTCNPICALDATASSPFLRVQAPPTKTSCKPAQNGSRYG